MLGVAPTSVEGLVSEDMLVGGLSCLSSLSSIDTRCLSSWMIASWSCAEDPMLDSRIAAAGGRTGVGRATGTFSHRHRCSTPRDTQSEHGWLRSHF